MARVNRIWPTTVASKANKELTLSAPACHISGPNSVNPGQILLIYGSKPNRKYLEDTAHLWKVPDPNVKYYTLIIERD